MVNSDSNRKYKYCIEFYEWLNELEFNEPCPMCGCTEYDFRPRNFIMRPRTFIDDKGVERVFLNTFGQIVYQLQGDNIPDRHVKVISIDTKHYREKKVNKSLMSRPVKWSMTCLNARKKTCILSDDVSITELEDFKKINNAQEQKRVTEQRYKKAQAFRKKQELEDIKRRKAEANELNQCVITVKEELSNKRVTVMT